MKSLRLWTFITLGLFVYQNCGQFKLEGTWELYSYRTQPDFFYDVKLVTRELDNLNRENYVVDFAVSYVHDPNAEVSYTVAFSTLGFSGVCPSRDGKAKGATQHFRMTCLLPAPDHLYIRLTLKGPRGEETVAQVPL